MQRPINSAEVATKKQEAALSPQCGIEFRKIFAEGFYGYAITIRHLYPG